MNFQTGPIYAVVLLSVIAIFFVTITIVRKNRSKKQTKRIVDTGSQMRWIDPDKIAKGLGAERVGEFKHKAAGGHFGALQTAADKSVASTIIEPDSTIIEAKDDLQIALTLAGLPTDPRNIIGQMFCFEAALPRSAERLTIIGTITGLEISNLDKGINLFLSARQFNGIKIERLHIEYVDFLSERHYVLILKDGSAIPGQFRLLNS